MPGPATRLTLLPYAQSFDGANVALRMVLLPGGSPLDPLNPGDPTTPPFATANLSFSLVLTSGLADMPPAGTQTTTTVALAAPAQAQALFTKLASTFTINPAPPAASPRRSMTVLKHLPPSYRDASGVTQPRTPFALTDDSYACAHRQIRTPKPLPHRADPIPWGRVIAIALRQPRLAEALGLIRTVDVPVPADALRNGGWVHVTLDPAGDAGLLGIPGALSVFASRIGPLTGPAPLFSAVLFPVPPSGTASYDTPFVEAIDYVDGFAKVVHSAQQQSADPYAETPDGTRPLRETGIRIGWDDEQVAIWLNRQTQVLGPGDPDTTMGVAGYRIDVREAGDANWHSLCAVHGDVSVDGTDLGLYDGEQAVETHPTQLDADTTGEYWLPAYFARWLGASVIGGDPIGRQLSGAAAPAAGGVRPVDPGVPLRYGTTYEFRVRLADHSSGGPDTAAQPTLPAIAPTASLPFRRWVPPGKPSIDKPASPDVTQVVVTRPRLGYPTYPCTGAANAVANLLADVAAAKAAGREPGLPDPDVASVQVAVQVRSLGFDPQATDGYVTLYTAVRDFPAAPGDPVTIDLNWTDADDATTLVDPGNGPLPLPTSRDVRLEVSALCRPDAHLAYFGADDVRTGAPSGVQLRKEAGDERHLLQVGSPADFLRAVFLQPDPADNPALANAVQAAGSSDGLPGDSVSRLAAALDLAADNLSLRSRPGRRLVIGAADRLRHALGPDNGSIPLTSRSELTQQWLVVLRARVQRDWSWDGVAPDGIVVSRDGAEVGRLRLVRPLPAEGEADGADRTGTDLVFIDAVDPKPLVGQFPRPLTLGYTLTTAYSGTPAQKDDPLATQDITLPVTTPPAQVPQLVSVGVALTPYKRSDDYSSTEQRRRMLWLQFDSDPADPDDALFARVLRCAPDPLLAGNNDVRVPDQPVEPPLPIDPEYTRVIVPEQSDDRAGVGAMQKLIRGNSPGHYVLPLPPGMHDTDPRLFGFFTNEFRVGHDTQWSTAQGRFGNALRVAGAQHPAPPLVCSVRRYTSGITASAPFASPVYDDANLRPFNPGTEMWMLLYTQVWRADRSGQQNVLLGRRIAELDRKTLEQAAFRQRLDTCGTARWTQWEVASLLAAVGMGTDSPLSVLAVEILPGTNRAADPLGADLGSERILRASPLIAVPDMCID
ncbi:MAG TPA: hypothetical protein VIN65_04475 [Candidatus Dormibacteraeota bacterium]